MCADGDPRLHKSFDHGDGGAVGFQFHRIAVGILDQTRRVEQSLFFGKVEGKEGHIAHNERLGSAAADRFAMVDHVIHRHGDGIRVTESRHTEGVADQDHIHAARLSELCSGGIVSGKHHDFFAVGLHLPECPDRMFFSTCHIASPQ